ncbi:amidase [Actinoplanes tereljensis]|uniref:Amidase n=1 Tax=Paractinoplanes tereljensis TaxID=571912 RepID=A0A919NJP1_9ACTN|nr:amidase family protein [Actinoplanes tereljensis]GIF19945.1 amidase [Actinoplanes tereljensis]
MDKLTQLTVVEIAEAVRSGSVSATDVVEAHLARIAEVNPATGAATVVLADQARAAAAEVDARIAAGGDPGPLAGVPVSVKENIDLTWSATTSGLPFAADHIPAENASFVTKLLAAGAIPVARGNMPDVGLRWDTDNDLFGRTWNPWDRSRVPGGSSGGDAVIVATGMAAAGLGNDYGGSLRLPANAAGIAALRPSAGRVPAPTRQIMPIELSLQAFAVNGPLARTVADLDLLFGVMHGADDVDPQSVTIPHPAGYDGPRRVAVTVDPAGWGVEPQVAAAVHRAADALAAAGWEVEQVDPPQVDRCATLWRQISASEMAPALLTPGVFPGPLSAGTVKYFTDNVAGVDLLDTAPAYAAAWAERHALAALWRQFHTRYPIVLGPVTTAAMPEIGWDLSGPEATTQQWRQHRLLVTANFLGLPAVAVPTGVADGRPQGVQVISRLNGDHIALAAARAIEAAGPALTPIDPRP